jgi:hypothetical protein
MKKHSVLGLSLLAAIAGGFSVVGCGSDDDSGNPPVTTAGSAGLAGASGMAAGGMSASAGTAGNATTAGAAGTAAGGSGGTCDIPTLAVFTRSDTDQSWDDNDFSDVMLTPQPACPVLVDVIWPHEAGWENADPSESNRESTHFTIDSSTSVDLTNKKLSLTIELAADERGPNAKAGAYNVSLVSVSTFDRVVMTGGAGAAAGGASGSGGGSGGGGVSGSGGASGGAGGTSGSGGASGGASGSSGDSSGGTAGAAVTTETGYTETETPLAERATLRFVNDRATVNLTLPNKTAEVGSYDPTRVIKINIRVYSVYSDGQTGMGGAGGTAGVGGTAAVGGSSGSGGTAGVAGKAGAGGTAGIDGLGGLGGAASGSGGASGGAAGGATVAPTYDYKTSKFAITNFVIKDATAP